MGIKAVILLGTLKSAGLSNTETLSAFLQSKMSAQNINCEIIKLVDYNILPGTYSDMGGTDEYLPHPFGGAAILQNFRK